MSQQEIENKFSDVKMLYSFFVGFGLRNDSAKRHAIAAIFPTSASMPMEFDEVITQRLVGPYPVADSTLLP